MVTLKLEVLSPVRDESDVFDHLVEVRRLDTNEVGLLLCSHCCRWPASLLERATWLEGCYTPGSYKDDPRLLLGYHPSSITRWEVNKAADGVFLELTADFSVRGDIDGDMGDWETIELEGMAPLPFYGDPDPTLIPRSGYMQRLWERCLRDRDLSRALQAFYRTLNAMVEAERMPLWVARSAWYLLGIDDLVEADLSFEAHFEHAALLEHACEVYANALIVVQDDPCEGYLRAVSIFNTNGDGWCVLDEALRQGADQYGWHPAVEIELLDEQDICDSEFMDEEGYTLYFTYHETEVLRDDLERGYAKAISLQCFEMVHQWCPNEHTGEDEPVLCPTVSRDDFAHGYAEAMPTCLFYLIN